MTLFRASVADLLRQITAIFRPEKLSNTYILRYHLLRVT